MTTPAKERPGKRARAILKEMRLYDIRLWCYYGDYWLLDGKQVNRRWCDALVAGGYVSFVGPYTSTHWRKYYEVTEKGRAAR